MMNGLEQREKGKTTNVERNVHTSIQFKRFLHNEELVRVVPRVLWILNAL